MKPFIIGVAGSSGSGKTTISTELAKHYGDDCVVISADSYYFGRGQMPEGCSFDDPRAIEFELLIEHLRQLKNGLAVKVPVYDFKTSTRTKETIAVEPKDIIIVEGILVLYPEELRELYTVSISVETDLEICRERRLKRDVEERGRTLEDATIQWTEVESCYREYVEPTKKFANISIANSSENKSLKFDITPVIEDLDKVKTKQHPAPKSRRNYSLFQNPLQDSDEEELVPPITPNSDF